MRDDILVDEALPSRRKACNVAIAAGIVDVKSELLQLRGKLAFSLCGAICVSRSSPMYTSSERPCAFVCKTKIQTHLA